MKEKVIQGFGQLIFEKKHKEFVELNEEGIESKKHVKQLKPLSSSKLLKQLEIECFRFSICKLHDSFSCPKQPWPTAPPPATPHFLQLEAIAFPRV